MPNPTKIMQPDLTTDLAKTELIAEADFHGKLRVIFSVPKAELNEHIKNNPDAPQKRGRKRKNASD